ncbi:MAG: S26 family signal peptidase [Roseitalea porphyridii]|jgi:conjugative transfer signal peptidase TraF|uniref:S26 family signal peptidase n=1 Tax=Pseudomonadota TaxID=1224 RepID=UPI0032EEC441
MNRRRVIILSAAGIGVAAIAWSEMTTPRPFLVYNASASVPIGFYRIADPQPLHVGDYVLAMPPEAIRSLIVGRGYVPPGTPLLKRVAATAGQHVCARGDALFTDRFVRVEQVLDRDSLGRPLPVWTGCRTLRSGEVFLLNAGVPNSLDSRIVGPIPTETVIGKAVPLWTF